MSIFLHGLALRNYRGIGPDTQYMAPFKDFNFFIGANNAGKSTVLNFLKNFIPIWNQYTSPQRPKPNVEPIDSYDGGRSGPPWMAIGIPPEQFETQFAEQFIPNVRHPIATRAYEKNPN